MCDPISLALTGTQIIGSISAYQGQKQAAEDQNRYNAQVTDLQNQYRNQLLHYNNEVFRAELDYFGEMLDYQQAEFDRQREYVEASQDAINRNYFNQLATLLTRQVEEAMATAFGIETIERQARRERATARAAAGERGVEGNSVEAILNDVSRQQGEAVYMMRLNQQAMDRQLMLEAMGLKAQADSALNNIPIRTFQPIAPPTAPAPVAPVNPAPVVRGPSLGSLIGSIGGDVVGGINQHLSRSPDPAAAFQKLREKLRL